VQVETWRAAYAGLLPEATIGGFDVAERQRLWREGLSRTPRPGSATFVAEVDGSVVGFASLGAAHEDGEAGEIYAIYVQPSSWGLGLGQALIERAEGSLRGSGFASALLWVLEGNERAERFYRAAGWSRDGRKDELFQGAEVVELRYRKQL
jgi:GNAT superfamily N-acetyltransferase